jgi:phage-related protein
MPFEVEFYKTDRGDAPVADYIEAAERYRRERARIVRTLDVLSSLLLPPASMFKKLKGQDNLWEVRVGVHRLLGFRHANLLILVHGFAKKSQQTPGAEIEVALRRKQIYLERKP